jgi:hypothetical protein
MAIIERGSFGSFFMQPDEQTLREQPTASGLRTFAVLSEVSSVAAGEPMTFGRSSDPRGLALGKLALEDGFQSFLQKLFHKTSKVYFLSWAWDLSGAPPSVYPGTLAPASLIPLKDGGSREFIGDGAVLFPARQITAGLTFRIQLWESKKGTREFGRAMEEVASAITSSELNKLLAVLATATGAPGATVSAIALAAAQLGRVIGNILKERGDDYADFFEGYYSASERWRRGREKHKGEFCAIELVRLR